MIWIVDTSVKSWLNINLIGNEAAIKMFQIKAKRISCPAFGIDENGENLNGCRCGFRRRYLIMFWLHVLHIVTWTTFTIGKCCTQWPSCSMELQFSPRNRWIRFIFWKSSMLNKYSADKLSLVASIVTSLRLLAQFSFISAIIRWSTCSLTRTSDIKLPKQCISLKLSVVFRIVMLFRRTLNFFVLRNKHQQSDSSRTITFLRPYLRL